MPRSAGEHGDCSSRSDCLSFDARITICSQGVLSRLHGLTLDNLVEIEAVLADGSVVRANETLNSDLFWASLPPPDSHIAPC